MSISTTQKPTTRRIVGMVVGIVIIGLGIALFKQSHLGNDSISALNMRLAELLGISLGVQNVATNILFFALEFWFGRRYIGLGTFVNGIGMGFIITFFYDPIAAAFGPAASLPEQLVWVVLARPMIRLFYGSIDTDVLDAGVKYLQIIALSYPFLALYNGGAALFRSIGNSKISMQISFLMNIINIVGNAVCIFGFKMGVDGVAWPSVVSRVVAAALILRKCYREDAVLTVPKTLRLDGGMAKRILGIGIPSAFENSLFEAGRILVVSMISTFGTVQIAANAVANNLDGMGVIPGKAISLAMITVVGRCIGAGDHEQTVYYTRKLLLWAYITMGLSNGAILLFLRQLVGIYALSGETMELAITLVTIHAGCAIIFWPLSFVLPNALRAANDVKFTMVVSILSMACWRLGFSYLLCVRMGWGAVGVWVAMVIDWTCRVTCFVLRFRSGAWKTKYQA